MKDIKHRALVVCEIGLLVVGIAVTVYTFSILGIGIPCVFKAVTSLDCPGCGLTRAAMALLKGDYMSAFRLNPFIYAIIILAAASPYYLIQYIKSGEIKVVYRFALEIMVISISIYGILRNIV